jgi:serine/threonine protein kinase
MSNDNSKNSGVGLAPGDRIGKYEVVEKLGVGGQAIIYKCRDSILDRFVAVKQMSPHLAEDPKFLERFRREAQILAKLGSEQSAVVAVYDVVEETRGLFIVMEFVPGHNLETILNDTAGPVEAKAVLQVLWRLAAGLHIVHSAGIIHRDLKPSNILIGDGLRVKITDFGVAASTSGQTSMVLGTTKYMAPELFEGTGVDGRADQYSLGFIIYEMLVGRPKFNEIFADLVRDRHSEALRWMKWHGNSAVQAPAAHEVNEAVPQPLSEIVARMMAKNPDDRFESMESLGRAIKVAFSNKAKPARRGGAGAASAAQPVSELASRSASGMRDEADDLDIAEANPTAPLPRKGMSRRAKFTLLGSAAGLLIVGLVAAMVISVLDRSRRQENAKTLYTTAYDSYREGMDKSEAAKLKSAADELEAVQTRYPGSLYASRASVLEPLARGTAAMLDHDWVTASQQQELAEERQRDYERQQDGPDNRKWAQARQQEIDNFRESRLNLQMFVETLEQSRMALREGRFDLAREVIDRRMREINSTTPQQDEQVRQLQTEIDREEVTTEIARLTKAAGDFEQAGDLPSAMANYADARDLLESERADIMPADKRQASVEQVRAKIETLRTDQTYDQSIQAAQRALQRNDLAAAVEAFKSANEIRPSAQLAGQIRDLRARILVAEGREALAGRNVGQARRKFLQALEVDPDNADAQAELDAIEKLVQRTRLVAEGDTALASGRYDDALAKYQAAANIRVDDDLTSKIVETRFRRKMAEAERLREAGQFDQAARSYQEAAAIKPEAQADIQARLVAMEQVQTYTNLLDQAQEAIGQRRFRDAMDRARAAEQIGLDERGSRMVHAVRYHDNLHKGQQAKEDRNWRGALGYYGVAKSNAEKAGIDTAKVDDLIKEAQQEIESL